MAMYEEDYRPRSVSGPGWLGVVVVSIITSSAVLLAFLLAVQKGLLTVHNVAAATAQASPEKPGTTHVKVPALVGLPVTSATELLAARGLHIVLRLKRANPAAADTVIAQDPLADSMLPRDAQVVVVLSSGPPGNVPVPAVLGLSLDDALEALESAGLKPGELLGP